MDPVFKITKIGVFYQYGYIDITKNRDPCPHTHTKPYTEEGMGSSISYILFSNGGFPYIVNLTLSLVFAVPYVQK